MPEEEQEQEAAEGVEEAEEEGVEEEVEEEDELLLLLLQLLLLLLPPLFLPLLLLLPLPEEKGGGARLAGSSRGLVRARGMSRMAAATTLAGGRCTLSEPRSAACTMWPSALNRRFSASSSACVRVWVGLTAPSYRTHQHR